jgi:hypothetical protein
VKSGCIFSRKLRKEGMSKLKRSNPGRSLDRSSEPGYLRWGVRRPMEFTPLHLYISHGKNPKIHVFMYTSRFILCCNLNFYKYMYFLLCSFTCYIYTDFMEYNSCNKYVKCDKIFFL